MADIPLAGRAENAAESPCTFSSSLGDSLTSSLHTLPWQPCSTALTTGTKRLRIKVFCAMELLVPSPLVAGPSVVRTHCACRRAESGRLLCARSHTLIQLPSRSPPTRSSLSHSRSFFTSHPSHAGCYPSSGRCGLRNWRTIGQQPGGLSKPGSPPSFSLVGHHFDSVLHVDVCCLREHHNMPVTMPGRTRHRCHT